MTGHSTDTPRWAERLKGAFWLALILFALAGLTVVGKLPLWIVGSIVAAGVALGMVGLASLPDEPRLASSMVPGRTR